MSDFSDEEVRVAREMLEKDNPTDEEIEKANLFFDGPPFKIADEKMTQIQQTINSYLSEFEKEGELSPRSKTITLNQGTTELRVTEQIPTVIYLTISTEGKKQTFSKVETELEQFLIFDVARELAFSSIMKESHIQFTIDLEQEFV
jgi:hypothetical protein